MNSKLGRVFCLTMLVAVLSATGCFLKFSTIKGKDAAEKAVSKFGEQINASKYQEICTDSADVFKKLATNDECLQLFEAVTRKLGQRKNGGLREWNINTTTDGTFVRLIYDTDFDLDKGTEEFVYKIDGDKAQLAGYHINSKAFMK